MASRLHPTPALGVPWLCLFSIQQYAAGCSLKLRGHVLVRGPHQLGIWAGRIFACVSLCHTSAHGSGRINNCEGSHDQGHNGPVVSPEEGPGPSPHMLLSIRTEGQLLGVTLGPDRIHGPWYSLQPVSQESTPSSALEHHEV